MARGRGTKVYGNVRAYAYLRLSVYKEDGNAQSIEARRNALRAYASRENIDIVEEFVDSGLSGQSAKRPEFNRMIAQATDGSKPVQMVVCTVWLEWRGICASSSTRSTTAETRASKSYR